MKAKISLVTLGVRDFGRAFAFYRDGLGFEPHHFTEGEDFCMFRMEGSWLALFPRDQLAADTGVEEEVGRRAASPWRTMSAPRRRWMRSSPRRSRPGPGPLRRRGRPSGAAMPGISPIRTAASGRWRITPLPT